MSDAQLHGAQPHGAFSAPAVVKDLERRWGLTLVSFVPDGSAAPLMRQQRRIRELLDHQSVRPDEPVVEFYDLDQLHCTHLTLTRSSARGPVRLADVVKPGVEPQQLCDVLARETDGLGDITVRLDRLALSDNGFVLFGTCADEASAGRRSRLLERLNAQLPALVSLSRRAWDTDPARHASMHLRLGFVKRPMSESLVTTVAGSSIEPVTLTFSDVTVVHHRYRTLRAPHAGSLRFPLNGPASDDRVAPPIEHLNLVS